MLTSTLRLVSLQVVTHRCILKTTLLISHRAQRTMYHAVHAALHCMHLASPCDELHQQPLLLLLRFAPAPKVYHACLNPQAHPFIIETAKADRAWSHDTANIYSHTIACCKAMVANTTGCRIRSEVDVPLSPGDRVALPPKLLQELQLSLLGSWCLIGHIPAPDAHSSVGSMDYPVIHSGSTMQAAHSS